MKIKGIKKIISLGEDELGEWDLCAYDEKQSKIKADIFIYSYTSGGYDGSGMAVWKKDDKWAYLGLAHCSCYGPTEDIESADGIKLTLKQLIKLLKENYEEDSIKVIEYLEKELLTNK